MSDSDEIGDVLERPLFDTVNKPLPIPIETYNAEPTITATLNRQWVSRLIGTLERLDQPDAWIGTDAEVIAARDNVREIIHELVVGSIGGNVDVRQNSTYPCILEKTAGVDTWVQFANLALCKSPLTKTIYDADTGELKYEDGTSARELDGRFISPRNEITAVDCDDAKAIVAHMQSQLDDIYDQLDAASGVAGIVGALSVVSIGLFGFGVASGVFAALASAAITIGKSAIQSAMVDAVWTRLLCDVHCVLDGAIGVTDEMYDAIVAGNIETGTAYTIRNHLLWQLGPVGLQNAIALDKTASAAVEAYDCASCTCGTFTHDWLGGDGLGDLVDAEERVWSNLAKVAGSHDSGLDYWVGVQQGIVSTTRFAGLTVQVTFPERTITALSADGYVSHSSNPANVDYAVYLKLAGNYVAQATLTGTGLKTPTWTGSVVADEIVVQVRGSRIGSSVTETTCRAIHVEGLGSDPF